ncbi:MAG: hypothetical protein HQ463_09120 [Bacteroidetes bacterium]|nr:hypothetical protein [Bacteroidota bacterium]
MQKTILISILALFSDLNAQFAESNLLMCKGNQIVISIVINGLNTSAAGNAIP